VTVDILFFVAAAWFFLLGVQTVFFMWWDSRTELTSRDFLQHVSVAAVNKLNASERAKYIALVRREKRREKK
jgi:hypothetical protein